MTTIQELAMVYFEYDFESITALEIADFVSDLNDKGLIKLNTNKILELIL